MNLSDTPKDRFLELLNDSRPHQALSLFIEELSDHSFNELTTDQLSMLHVVCEKVLPQVLQNHVLWFTKHSDIIRQLLKLLPEALEAGYNPPSTVDHIAWLRCLLAIEEARAGRVEQVLQELCLVDPHYPAETTSKPNGTFHQQLQNLELTEKSSLDFQKGFFKAYMEFLKRAGKFELSGFLESRIGKLLGQIARDEERAGVVHALFYDKSQTGHSAFVHVTTEYQNEKKADEPKDLIEYACTSNAPDDPVMKQAVLNARLSADSYLKGAGFPDGLDQRIVRWEIGDVQGDPVELKRQFQGGSIALPLAVSIVSQYLDRPVQNDITFTGTFHETTTVEGVILPVDGVPEKVKHAVLSGCKVLYLPQANLTEINSRPCLQKLIGEHKVQINGVENFYQVCGKLFPQEGTGKLKDLIKDIVANIVEIFNITNSSRETVSTRPVHIRYRRHILLCSFLTAMLMFLEGCRLYKAFALEYSVAGAWIRIVLSTLLVFIGMLISFSLPGAFLVHRKNWSWYAGIVLLKIFCTVPIFLIGLILSNSTNISSTYNAPPIAGMIKDMFLFWLFTWALVANTFHVTAALEHLVSHRQFITARACMRWNSFLEARIPLRCVYFAWQWDIAVILLFVLGLIVPDFHYFSTIDTSTTAGYWEVTLGIVRDILFLIAIAEVMIVYKPAIARIRAALS